jgi:hypothetical protein
MTLQQAAAGWINQQKEYRVENKKPGCRKKGTVTIVPSFFQIRCFLPYNLEIYF